MIFYRNIFGKRNCCKYNYFDDFFVYRKCGKLNNIVIIVYFKIRIRGMF